MKRQWNPHGLQQKKRVTSSRSTETVRWEDPPNKKASQPRDSVENNDKLRRRTSAAVGRPRALQKSRRGNPRSMLATRTKPAKSVSGKPIAVAAMTSTSSSSSLSSTASFTFSHNHISDTNTTSNKDQSALDHKAGFQRDNSSNRSNDNQENQKAPRKPIKTHECVVQQPPRTCLEQPPKARRQVRRLVASGSSRHAATNGNNKSLLPWLLSREIYGGRTRFPPYPRPQQPQSSGGDTRSKLEEQHGTGKKRSLVSWKLVSKVLVLNPPTAHVRHLQFDKAGTLLAVMTTNNPSISNRTELRVLDWGSFAAADRRVRNRQAQGGGERGVQLLGVQPLRVVQLTNNAKAYVDMQWNPFQSEELAILDLNGFVKIYNLGQGPANHSSRQWSPKQGFQLDPSMSRGADVGHLLYVSPKHLIVSLGCHVACYKLLQPKAKLLWLWPNRRKSVITSILSLPNSSSGSDLLLLGTEKGMLMLVSWKQMERAAFSVLPIPLVRGEWSTLHHGGGFEYPKHPAGAMGIVNLRATCNKPCTIDLSWHTLCGWALRAALDTNNSKWSLCYVHVVYQTPRIRTFDENGRALSNTSNQKLQWSVPSGGDQVLGTNGPGALVWTSVSAMTRHLPPSDRRVLGGGSSTALVQEDQQRAVNLLWTNAREMNSLPFLSHTSRDGIQQILLRSRNSLSMKWTVSGLAMHPSQEWMVVGTDRGLRIYNARSRSATKIQTIDELELERRQQQQQRSN